MGYEHGANSNGKVAIFRRKMSGFRMFLAFREREARRNACIIGLVYCGGTGNEGYSVFICLFNPLHKRDSLSGWL